MSDYSMSIYLDGVDKGKEEGQNLLVKAIQLLRDGKKDEEILKDGVDEDTLNLAKVCK